MTSNDGTTNTACSTDPAHPAVNSATTPTLGATVTGPSGATAHAEFEISDFTSGAAVPPLLYRRPGSASTAGTSVSVTTPALVSGHVYAWAARPVDAVGDQSFPDNDAHMV